MTREELKQVIAAAMSGKNVELSDPPSEEEVAAIPDLMAEELANAIAEYVKNPED